MTVNLTITRHMNKQVLKIKPKQAETKKPTIKDIS